MPLWFVLFFALCRTALNPNISQAAVDEMLVQHLLTERLIRKIFDNPEFTRRNVIAIELEKVINALVSLSFNRDSFLRSLDRFYRAIEDAARGLEDFSEKQRFLNTVDERLATMDEGAEKRMPSRNIPGRGEGSVCEEPRIGALPR